MRTLEYALVPLYLRRVISNYLMNRALYYDTGDAIHIHYITGRVPQGLVLGHQLQNVHFDNCFGQQLPDGISIVSFNREVSLLIVEKISDEL